MKRKGKKTRGQSLLEFVAVIIFLLGVFIYFQKYIVRGFSGRWKGVGDALGQGRIYDPHKTTECAANSFFPGVAAVWYDAKCFDANCTSDCLGMAKNSGSCSGCLAACSNPLCN